MVLLAASINSMQRTFDALANITKTTTIYTFIHDIKDSITYNDIVNNVLYINIKNKKRANTLNLLLVERPKCVQS
jgi:hypothetical protein